MKTTDPKKTTTKVRNFLSLIMQATAIIYTAVRLFIVLLTKSNI